MFNKIGRGFIYFFAVIAILNIFIIGIGEAQSEADALLEQSNNARVEAFKGHCEQWNDHMRECYMSEGGNESECDALVGSSNFFQETYNDSPHKKCRKHITDFSFLE